MKVQLEGYPKNYHQLPPWLSLQIQVPPQTFVQVPQRSRRRPE